MRIFTLLVALSLVVDPFAGAGTAHAEFQIAGPDVSPPPAPIPASQAEAPLPRPLPRLPAPPVALGFGDHVPLAFAARQIVPAGVKVAFGKGLEPEAVLVDWKGGRPWPEILRSTLRPVGLQVTFRPGSVLIERASAS